MERGAGVSAEIDTYAHELLWILDQVGRSLESLTAQQLTWQPPIDTANCAAAITTHIVHSTRVYALGFGCGHPVMRDRPAEFAATDASVENLVAALRHLSEDLTAAFDALTPQQLDERFEPPQELLGTGPIREISRRDALVESIRHAALHLGELRLTCDLACQYHDER